MIPPRILPLAVLLYTIVSFAIFTGSARAQTIQNDETAALRQKAFDLLESVGGQIGTLQSAENRARLGANIADSLWPHDEKRARSILLQVEADIRAELQKWQPQTGTDATLFVFLKLRVDTVERIAKHDGEAALAFLKGTELQSGELLKHASQNFGNIEMRLAQKIAADNPEAAVKLASETMERTFDYSLISLLGRLNRKHKESAQTLYKEILNKLQSADLVTDWNARLFAGNLAHVFPPPVVNEALYRELISIFVNTALKNGCGEKLADEDLRRNYCHWVASEVPEMEKFDARAARLRHWTPESIRDSFRQSPEMLELDEVFEEGTTEEILAAASKYPKHAERAYWQLIERALEAGDLEQVRKIANTYITDPERRRYLLTQLDNAEKKIAYNEAWLKEIEEKLNTIPRLLYRVSFLLTEAHRIGYSDQKLALKLLDRASDLIDTMKPGKEQTQVQLGLAVLYCYENSERGMGIMESLMPRLNELVDMAARLDGYETNYLRDGEWNMSANGSIGELLTRLSQMAGPFAWLDFDRAVSLASRFDRAELRMMAHVKLAQGILAGPPKRLPAVYTGY